MNLADSELNQLFEFKKRSLDKASDGNFDHIDLAESCVDFYTKFLGLKTPKVLVADGPTQAVEFLNHILGKRVSNELVESYPFSETSKFKSISKEISARVFEEAKTAKNKVKGMIGEDRYRESKNILLRDLNYQISQTVFAPSLQGLNNKFRTELDHFELALYPSLADWDWVMFYSCISDVFEIDGLIPIEYERLLDSGLYGAFLFDQLAILIPKPVFISKGDEMTLHNEVEPAVQWKDGTTLCFWNGVEIPNKLICYPEEVTSEDILKETNAEVRRCYQEALGSERFGSLLGLVPLDRKSDRFGNELILYRTKERDTLAGGYIYFAKVVCPSTGRIYFLCVPPGFNTVEEAVSWTFGKTPGEYKPVIET
ncbi:MAG: DUF6745 domain-containing protein [Bacteroidota bacterium]